MPHQDLIRHSAHMPLKKVLEALDRDAAGMQRIDFDRR